MARCLRHDGLMRVSHSHVAATARDDKHAQRVVAMRLIEHPGTYTDWENTHSHLMHKVCQPTKLRDQIISMRSTTLSLIHRRAVFEYLRDCRVTGVKRHRYIGLFYGSRDYATSMVIEFGHYTRSWVSASCSRFIGLHLLRDPAFETPLSDYEQWYAEYFRMFCEVQLASPNSAASDCTEALLPFLKERARTAREQLLRM